MQLTTSAPPQKSPAAAQTPNPGRIIDTLLFSHARADALKAAIDLDVFSAIGEGRHTIEEIAQRCAASKRGIRSLCDFLVVNGFLAKAGLSYDLVTDSQIFLDRRSPAYLGSVAEFMASRWNAERCASIAQSVRDGRPALDTIMSDPAIWLTFAHAMLPLAANAAAAVAEQLGAAGAGDLAVLDIAASNGEYGLAVARVQPRARVVAVDWPDVLAVARQRAADAGCGGRCATIAGDAFTSDLGGPYDVALLPNLLHGFDRAACETLLRKVHGALREGGRVAIVEFVPAPDRVTPPFPAMFSLMILVSGSGDAYTHAELDDLLRRSGFGEITAAPLPPSPQTLILAKKT
jgi:SAM-dependent methyltransferase